VTVRNRFLALVCLLSSLSLFADIEILYFTKPNELIVESATLFNREKKSDNKGNNNGEETKYETVYAFCGEIADDCNRKTAKKIIKIITHLPSDTFSPLKRRKRKVKREKIDTKTNTEIPICF
jgi:hypothetical protein